MAAPLLSCFDVKKVIPALRKRFFRLREAPALHVGEPPCRIAHALQLLALAVFHHLALALAKFAQHLDVILFFPNFCSIVSGCLAAKLLQFFESPKCFAYLFKDSYFFASRGDRYLSHNSRHTQVPVPATIIYSLLHLLDAYIAQNQTDFSRV